jgi:hypothetical protein
MSSGTKRRSFRRQEVPMRKLCTIIAGVAAWLAFSTAAYAKIAEYISPHPVPHKYGGGFCNIDVAHVHNYDPDDQRMYREIGGKHYFVGDPTPFQYDGPRHTYYGAHPVVDAEVQFDHPIYCYMKGPHYHWYEPPAQAHFEMRGGAYWYVGAFPRAYYDERPRFAVVNEVYAPLPYVRPMVDIHVAPPMVAAQISIGGPGWGAAAVVGGPAIPLLVPPVPIVPVPVGVGVVGGVNMGIGGPAIIDGRYHHDRGRHEGWRHDGWRGPDRFHGGSHPAPPPHFGGPAPAHRGFAGPAPQHGPVFGRPGPSHGGGRGPNHRR